MTQVHPLEADGTVPSPAVALLTCIVPCTAATGNGPGRAGDRAQMGLTQERALDKQPRAAPARLDSAPGKCWPGTHRSHQGHGERGWEPTQHGSAALELVELRGQKVPLGVQPLPAGKSKKPNPSGKDSPCWFSPDGKIWGVCRVMFTITITPWPKATRPWSAGGDVMWVSQSEAGVAS